MVGKWIFKILGRFWKVIAIWSSDFWNGRLLSCVLLELFFIFLGCWMQNVSLHKKYFCSIYLSADSKLLMMWLVQYVSFSTWNLIEKVPNAYVRYFWHNTMNLFCRYDWCLSNIFSVLNFRYYWQKGIIVKIIELSVHFYFNTGISNTRDFAKNRMKTHIRALHRRKSLL